jgi:hypothetical protein
VKRLNKFILGILLFSLFLNIFFIHKMEGHEGHEGHVMLGHDMSSKSEMDMAMGGHDMPGHDMPGHDMPGQEMPAMCAMNVSVIKAKAKSLQILTY